MQLDLGAAIRVSDPPLPEGELPVHLVAVELANEPFGWWTATLEESGALVFEGLPPDTEFELRPGGRRVTSGASGTLVDG
ncbi:MAG: hypothetical protein R3F34_04095 [Planctomycetota bacterium]